MSQEFAHLSVLLNETVDGLNIQRDGIYIDGTFGRGGHSRHVLSHLGENGRLIAIDRDPQAIEAAKQFADDSRFQIVHGGFGQLAQYVEELGLTGKINGVLLDLGVSSPQLDDAERGFSFLRDGPLDMRMDNSQGQTAAQWIARAEIEDMAWVFKTYGEEKNARHIARCIAADREKNPFLRTKELADLIARITKNKERNKHPATRVFQAIACSSRMYDSWTADAWYGIALPPIITSTEPRPQIERSLVEISYRRFCYSHFLIDLFP